MIKNEERIKTLIKSLSGEEPHVIGVSKELIHFLGDARKAVLLSQLVYWSGRGVRRDGYIYKTYDEMFLETGIKQKTCNRYYQQFREMGFFDWTTKMANGFRTVHFKIDLDKLSESLKTFWLERNRQTVSPETVNLSEPITENTTQNTNNNTLSSKDKKVEEQIDNFSSQEDLTGFECLEDFFDSFNYPDSSDLEVPLPEDFEPTLENQFWSVSNFPEKSIKIASQNFVSFYEEKPNIIRTLSNWQKEWRKWMQKEYPIKGYDEEKLIAERELAVNSVLRIVYLFAYNSQTNLLSRNDFYNALGKEEYCLSRETIDNCLERLELNEALARLFNDYYYVAMPKKRLSKRELQWSIYREWNCIDDALENFIISDHLVTREQLRRKFPRYCQSSIDRYLDSGIERGALELRNGHYYNLDFFDKDAGFQAKISSKLAALSIDQ